MNSPAFGLTGDSVAAIHLDVRPGYAGRVLALAREHGYRGHHVDMSAVASDDDYHALLEKEFRFPGPVVNDHGVIDWLSDLEWFGEYPGHIVASVVREANDFLAASASTNGLNPSLPVPVIHHGPRET